MLKLTTIVLIFVVQVFCDLRLELKTNMPPVVTNVNLSHYDFYATGTGGTIFTIKIFNDNSESYNDLQLIYQLLLKMPEDSDYKEMLYNTTNKFDISSNEKIVEVTSKEFVQVNHPDARFTRQYLGRYGDYKGVRAKILDAGKIMTTKVRFIITLTGPDHPSLTQELSGQILNVNRMMPISPGSEIGASSEGFARIQSAYPLFQWSSDLYPGIYGSDDVFELNLYKLEPGESPEALTNPIYSIATRETSHQYPVSAPLLEQGGVYVWEVLGFLKGPANAIMPSPRFGFFYAGEQLPDPSAVQVIQSAIRILQGSGLENMISHLEEAESLLDIKINGNDADFNDIRDIEKKIQEGKYHITGANIR